MKHNVRLPVLASLLLCLLAGTVSAAGSGYYTPYASYEYNTYDESVPAPVGYVQQDCLTGLDMGLETPLSGASDMLVSGSAVYILDSSNSRIVVLDTDFRVTTVYEELTIPAELSELGFEETLDFTGAQGIAVDAQSGRIYIADTENERIVVLRDGQVAHIIRKPETTLLDETVPFRVTKLAVGNNGKLFAVAESVNTGAFVFSSDTYAFERFFGSNKVEVGAGAFIKYIQRRFMTREQLAATDTYTPVTITNFDMDAMGFLVTVSNESGTEPTVNCFNYQGEDTLGDVTFGDKEQGRDVTARYSQFIDVDVDEDGYYIFLDALRGRIFVYHKEGDLIATFGALGTQKGTFSRPVAVESIGERILVLDSGKNQLHVFEPTEYTRTFRMALVATDAGDFANAETHYRQLLDANANNTYAYYGLARIYDEQGDYQQAMALYRLADDRDAYSEAFRDYRKEFVQQYLGFILLGVAIVIVVAVVAVRIGFKRFRRAHQGAYSIWESKPLMPLYVLAHPTDGFSQFRQRKNYSLGIAAGIAVGWFLLSVLEFHGMDFIFNENRPVDFSLFITLAKSVGLLALFILANWSICTLMEGKGKLSEIVATVCYSTIPYFGSVLLCIGLSHFLALEEAGFLTLIRIVGILWSGLVLFAGLYSIHQYSTLKTLGSVLLTVVGMLVILFLIVLFYTLITQTLSFVRSIYQEYSLR